ncbi:TonB-dependent receptor [Alcanivorax sp. S6407]|uniref:TonB-dependent receptor domain-containing protein n=1 Tax=Alcanivorax sp. S6407 TaxID=2926424 RepID=UPI001FF102A8|nr:TonB-dependent receptor [Alcanivorax sp. S6407]MCK0153713.1 TonB-dependent receptor [Alcanivorax sp. S6407]
MSLRFMAAGSAALFLLPLAASSNEPVQLAVLDPIVVTPTLSSVTAEASLSSVTVIDEQTLRDQQPLEMRDVLRGQPGVDTYGNGSFGKISNVSIRGTSSNASLLMIDGVRLRSATTGAPAWEFLPPQMFERVEIVRGPRGSLYGADAVGGVVQLFGRDSGEWLTMGGGSFASWNLGAGASLSEDGTSVMVGANVFDTEGTEIREHSHDRGFHNESGIFRISHQFDDRGSIGLFRFSSEGDTEFEGSTPEQKRQMEYLLQVTGLKGDVWISEDWQLKALVSEAQDESEDFTDGLSNGDFNTRTRTANVQSVSLWGNHQFILGGEYQSDEVLSSVDYDEPSRDNKAAFAQALLAFGALDLQASLRHDDNDAYGSKVTGAGGVGFKLNDQHRLRASYGTAYRAPTFNDLYYPDSPPFYFSNPNLEPESSETGELGLRGQYSAWYWDAAFYRTNIEDMIVYDFAQATSLNLERTTVEGAELAMGLDWENWRAALAFTAVKPEDRETGNIIAYRAQRSGRLDIDRRFGEVSLGATASFQGHRYTDAANTDRLSGFGLVDLRASWDFAENWTGRVVVENLLDKEYVTARSFAGWDYLNSGRAVMVSLSYDTQ